MKTKKNLLFFFLTLLTVGAGMAGCAGKVSRQAVDSIDDSAAKSGAILDSVKNNIVKDNGGITFTDTIWVSAKKVDKKKENEPKWLSYEFINIVKEKGSLREAANAINNAIKDDKVYISDDLEQYMASNKEINSLELYQDNGTIKDFLNKITGAAGAHWKIDDGRVKLYLTETKTFTFRTIVGELGATGGVQTSAEGGGAMNSSFSYKSDIWKNITESVKALLSSKGKMVANEGMGKIIVTDTPERMSVIEEVVNNYNRELSKIITFNVVIVSIKDNKEDGSSFDLAPIYKTLSNTYQISLNSSIAAVAGGGTLSVLKPINATPTSPWEGTSAIINSLNKVTKTKAEFVFTGSTPNNIPMPIAQSNDISYIKEITPPTTNQNGTTSGGGITPGTISTGLYLMLLPKVINSHQVLLQVSVEQSELVNLKKEAASAGGNGLQIQTPERAKNTLVQRVPINSGETLMIAGITREGAVYNDQTVVPGSSILGGANSGKRTKDRLLIFITPSITEID